MRPRASAAARRFCAEGDLKSSIESGGRLVAPQADNVDRGLADRLVGISQEVVDHALLPPASSHPGERPDDVAAQARRRIRSGGVAEQRQVVPSAGDDDKSSIARRCTAGRGIVRAT